MSTEDKFSEELSKLADLVSIESEDTLISPDVYVSNMLLHSNGHAVCAAELTEKESKSLLSNIMQKV